LAETLRSTDVRTQLNSIRGRSAKARIDANRTEPSGRIESREEFLSLIRGAMKDAGMSQKEFALNAGAVESSVADGFNGVRNFAADWLWNQPPAFWLALRDRIEAAKGLTADREREVKAARIGELVRLLLEVA